jgi:hypothetical protein
MSRPIYDTPGPYTDSKTNIALALIHFPAGNKYEWNKSAP